MLYYTLNKNLDGNKIIQDIIKIVGKIPKDEIQNTVLSISLQKIVSCSEDRTVRNIEYQQPLP